MYNYIYPEKIIPLKAITKTFRKIIFQNFLSHVLVQHIIPLSLYLFHSIIPQKTSFETTNKKQ